MHSVIRETGLPIFRNAQAWYGPQMKARTEWIHELSAPELAEIDRAVAAVESSGTELVDLRRGDFPLDGLAATLRAIRQEVLHGRGFVLMRGLPVQRYSRKQAAIAYLGIGAHLGEPVSQNGKGHILGHVKNLGLDYRDPEVRFYQTDALLEFHTDYSDIVGLLCLQVSRAGGASSIVSSTTVWNEMVRRRADLARAMQGPMYYTRSGEIAPGQRRYSEVPAFTPCDGRLIAFYRSRTTSMKAQAFPEVPRLTASQLEGMDYVETLSSDPDLRLDMDFRIGDMQFLCNYSIFHARTAYQDWPEPERRRHLLRLWLACEDGPALPAYLTSEGSTRAGRPDGIHVPCVPFKAPLEAE